jgi:DNA-binding LacI/PurR family transcriptional regulator
MRQLLFESGKRGVEVLLDILENPAAKPMCDVLPAELIVRGTTAPPP